MNKLFIALLFVVVTAASLCAGLPANLPEALLGHSQSQQESESFSLSSGESDSSEADAPTKYTLLDSVFSVTRFSSEVFRVIVPPNTDELYVSMQKIGPASHSIALELRYNAYPTHLSPDTLILNNTNSSFKITVPRPKAGTWIALAMYDNSTGRTAMHPLYDSNKVMLSISITAVLFNGPVYEATHICAQPQHFVAQTNYTADEIVFSFPVAPRTSSLRLNVLSTSGTQACLRYGALPLGYNTSGTLCLGPVNSTSENVSFVLSKEIPEEGLWFLSISGTELDIENDVWLSITENVCPTNFAGEDCTGSLTEVESYVPGLFSRFDYLHDNSTYDDWAYFMYDHTYAQVFGDTLYFGPLYFYSNITVYLRRNAPPTKEVYDFAFNSSGEFKIVNPEHTVWYAGVYVPDYKEVNPNATHSSFYFFGEECENSCNGHTCKLSYENGFLTGTCHCSMTKGGSDCSQRVKSQSLFVFEVFLLVVSNIAFVPAIYYAYSRWFYVECLLFCLSMVVSALYHLCDEAVWCIASSYSVLQFSDFFFAFSSVIAVAFVLSGLIPKIRLPLFYAMEIILYMMFSNDTTSAVFFVVIFVLTVVIILTSWTVLYLLSPAKDVKSFIVKLFKILDIRFVAGGLGIVIFSIISFVVETNKTYFIWHSLWHVCVMLGAWLLLYSAKFKVDVGLYGNMEIFADAPSESSPRASDGIGSGEGNSGDVDDEDEDDSDENTIMIETRKN